MSLLTLIILILVTVLIIAIALYFLRPFLTDERLPYVARESLNTPGEGHFFRALQKAVRGRCYVAPKVRVADVLDVGFPRRHSQDQRWWRYFRQISSKHVDFVLCDFGGGRILAAIELDDRSHTARERQVRDEFLDRAFRSSGLPLIRVPVQTHYEIGTLRSLIERHIGQGSRGNRESEDRQG